MIGDILKGIKTKYTGSELASVLTGGLWDMQAPEGTVFPYATVQIISNMNYPVFTNNMEFFRIHFNIVSDNMNKDATNVGINALESALRTLFDGEQLSGTGWTTTNMVWQKSEPVLSFSNKTIGVMVEYETHIVYS